MTRPTLLARLKEARVVRVILVYLGASWVVLQFVETLVGLLSLPEWVGPVALVLLGIGLMVVLATAWVQSLPATAVREEAGEVPTDWQIAPRDVLASVKAGKLPHLTWGRSILGGVLALVLLFAVSGAYLLATGGRAPGFGPAQAGADVAATGIAVVPFTVTGGAEFDLWRDGMVDVLSTNLDGLGGYRTIDARTVLARWRENVAADAAPDLRTALDVAERTGARYAVLGTLVGSPSGIRVGADIYDLASGSKVVQEFMEGPADRVLELTGELSVALVRGLLGASGQRVVQEGRREALTTTSLPALRAFLEGEAAFRRADFPDAVAAYERAVAQDSLFALAWSRLSDSYGWLESIGSAEGNRATDRAIALLDRLPARERIIVQAGYAASEGDVAFLPRLREAVQRYPDDPDLWYNLGDFILHVGQRAGTGTMEQAAEAFDRAIALDPGFAPYQQHPIEFAVARGDRADAEARAARYGEASFAEGRMRAYALAIPLLLGDSAEFQTALAATREAEIGTLQRMRVNYTNMTDQYGRLRAMLWHNRDRAGADHQWILYSLIAEGALRRGDRLTDSLDVPVWVKGLALGWARGGWTTASALRHGAAVSPALCEEPTVSTQCQLFVGWGLARSGDLAGAAESARILRSRAAAAEGAAAITIRLRADIVEGTIAAVRGRTSEARELLMRAATNINNEGTLARTSLGDLESAAGNIAEAIRYHQGNLRNYERVHATLALARIHDARGEIDQAANYYRSFLTITADGDADLPEIVEARSALVRLRPDAG